MITIVFGKPGAGKTAFLVADAVRYMNFSEDCRTLYASCCDEVKSLNAAGACYSLPLSAPVYSNFPISVSCGVRSSVESYYIDGFHLGFENEDVPVMPILPESRIYLSEAQRYYNSRRSKDLPDWVSRFYEEHRHFGLNIMLDVQRPGLIDINIREICERFVEVRELEHKTDAAGNITATIFHYREFEDWTLVENYLSTGEKCYAEQKHRFDGNVFDCYTSRSYFSQFLPRTDFSLIPHLHGDGQEDIELAKMMYQQTPPEGFYGAKKRRIKDEV